VRGGLKPKSPPPGYGTVFAGNLKLKMYAVLPWFKKVGTEKNVGTLYISNKNRTY